MRQLGGTPEATVIGCGTRIDPVRAAAHGAAMHGLDFEPMCNPRPVGNVAGRGGLAKARGLPGQEVLAALIKAMEIQGRLARAPVNTHLNDDLRNVLVQFLTGTVEGAPHGVTRPSVVT